ncbi:MAG: hypothetical protein DRH21_01785 [Deltaproteobacteria bacterium]|nr:MAG: hypothetical protein DRH21_01785 [Deltaproteobacteria bacterium]
MYLNKLQKILTENNEKYLFPCIVDLVANGLNLERFSNEDNIPSRQDITQYIAAWFKYIGLSSDECREWMIEYCIGVLSAISTSSKSQIRHSTKCNIKYIYKSDVTFDCRCEKNRFKAPCESTCPIYEEMAHRAKESEAANIVESYEAIVEDRVADEIAPIKYSIKDEYKDQFEKAIEAAQHHLKQRVSKKEIVNLLNESGFKTITGKKWSYSILANELRKLNRNINKAEAEKIRDKKPIK